MQKSWYLYNARIFSQKIFHIYSPHMSSQSVYFYSIEIIFDEVVQHQSRCSIFANQQLTVSNIFLCSCCFRPTATCQYLAFVPLLIYAHQPVYWLLSPRKASNLSVNLATVVLYPKPSFRNVFWQTSWIKCKNIQAFLRYSNFRVGIFYFASPCMYQSRVSTTAHLFKAGFWLALGVSWEHCVPKK